MINRQLSTIAFAVAFISLSSAQAQDKTTQLSKEYKTKSLKDIAASFTFVHSKNSWTRVPKDSILHVPKSLEKQFSTFKPKGKYTRWRTFLRYNRAIVTTVEVDAKHIYGKSKFSANQIQKYQDLKKIVISTYNGSPIAISSKTTQPEPK